jgi:hypothetical protein
MRPGQRGGGGDRDGREGFECERAKGRRREGKLTFFVSRIFFEFFFGYVLVAISFLFNFSSISKSVASRIILRFIAKLWLARCQIFCPPFLKLQ